MKIPYRNTESYVVNQRIIKAIELEFETLISTRLTERDKDNHRLQEDRLRRYFSFFANAAGNIESIYNRDNYQSSRANREQLWENLSALFVMIKSSDPWIEDLRAVYKKHLPWAKVNYSLVKLPGDNSYFKVYREIFDFCHYTDEEVIAIVHQYPNISRLYSGENSTIHSLGALLQ